MDELWTMLSGSAVAVSGILGLVLGWRRRAADVLPSAVVVGVLAAVFWCALTEAFIPVHAALEHAIDGLAGYRPSGWLACGLAGGFLVGLAVTAGYETWSRGAGASRKEELTRGEAAHWSVGTDRSGGARHALWSPRRSMLVLATGTGLCGLGAGLAIGSVAVSGETGLAILLTAAFVLHTGTEAFAVTAPLTASGRRRWGLLGSMGVIGGAPAVLGTFLGRRFTNDTDDVLAQSIGVAVLALAVGIMLHLLIRRVGVLIARGRPGLVYTGIGAGFVVALVGDLALMVAVGTA